MKKHIYINCFGLISVYEIYSKDDDFFESLKSINNLDIFMNEITRINNIGHVKLVYESEIEQKAEELCSEYNIVFSKIFK